MNNYHIVLAVFCALAAVMVVYLSVRLYRKEAELREANSKLAVKTGYEGPDSSQFITLSDQFLYDRCCRYMVEKKPFLVPNYSLQDLSNAMFTNRFYLSKTINRFSGKNFRGYLNYYRVMYAMELFRGNMSLRINDLAQLSGFNTESSFLNSFKTVMGETPSQWCARVRRKISK